MERKTVLSSCRLYRYSLWREIDARNPEYALFIGLNPSSADEVNDDPTIRRCIDFARRWDFGGLCMTNLFALRATDPKIMKAHHSPIGADNDRWLKDLAEDAAVIVAAWGVHGCFAQRDAFVKRLLKGRLSYLALSKDGHPRHPLYFKQTLTPIRWD